jgi:anti-sigma B factor antagonist
MFWATHIPGDEYPVVELHGELDIFSAEQARDALHAAIISGPRMVIDLEKLEFLDCAGLRVLLRAQERCDSLGGWLVPVKPQGIVRRLLDALDVWWEDSS